MEQYQVLKEGDGTNEGRLAAAQHAANDLVIKERTFAQSWLLNASGWL